MKKLPLINSDNKKVRILGYVVYAWLLLSVLGSFVPAETENLNGERSTEIENSNLNEERPEETEPKTIDEWYTAAQNIVVTDEDEARKRIEYSQHVLDADPNNLSALWMTAYTYRYGIKDKTKGLEYLETILKLQPRNTYFLALKSAWLDESGNFAEAMSIQDEIINIATDGKPFSDDENGDEAEECGDLAVLAEAWTTKDILAIKLKLGWGVVTEYRDKGEEYGAELWQCKGIE